MPVTMDNAKVKVKVIYIYIFLICNSLKKLLKQPKTLTCYICCLAILNLNISLINIYIYIYIYIYICMYVFIYSKVAIVYTDIDIPENQRNWLIACGVDINTYKYIKYYYYMSDRYYYYVTMVLSVLKYQCLLTKFRL